MSRSIEQTGKGVEAVARAGEGQFALAGRLGGEASSEEDAAVLPDRETPAAPQSEAGHDAALQAEGPEGSSDFGEQVRAITQQIIDLMGLELSAGVTSADRYQVTIDLEGADTRIVIGKHGQTLEALQHVVGLIANKDAPRHRRVVVDAESYQQRRRERREEELLEMVRRDALQAKEAGQEAVIQYAVGPYERRIVHMAFKDDPDFVTYSEGDEPHRYVVVSPRD